MTAQKNYTPEEVEVLVRNDQVFLVDVREVSEYADGHIADAVLCPLSAFDPSHLPDTAGKPIVFYCAGGVRSARAIAACAQAGLPHDAHLEGGIKAWMNAGLPVQK
jgi:rhodanese-related sulfurtransferase